MRSLSDLSEPKPGRTVDSVRGGRSGERGVALILVLVMLPLVAILMTQLNFETAIGTRLSSNALATQQFRSATLARLRQMRLRLKRDLIDDEANAQESGGAYDHPTDTWGPALDGGGTTALVQKGDDDRGDEVTIYTQVNDEQGRFNVNNLLHRDAARAQIWQQRFKSLLDIYRDDRFGDLETSEYDLNAQEAQEILEAVLKFLKGDERNENVRKVEIPDATAELPQTIFTVRDLIFSHRLFAEKRLLETFVDLETGTRIVGLEDLLTVYGDGKINVNSASIQVLRSLFNDEEAKRVTAEAIYKQRGGYLNTTEERQRRDDDLEQREEDEAEGVEDEASLDSVFKSLNEVSQVENMGDGAFLRRNEIDQQADFTVRSMFFQVIVTARRENYLRQQRVVFERHSQGCITWFSEVRAAEISDLPEILGGESAPAE